MFYPPPSGVPSEASSAVVSESDLPSAAVSDSDLLFPPKGLSAHKKQAGIQEFFRVLSEDEVQAAQAKRKWVDSEEEEADRAQRRKKEEKQKQKKLNSRRENNRLAQQKHRRKLVEIDIEKGVRNSEGELIQVSSFTDCIVCMIVIRLVDSNEIQPGCWGSRPY